jgi:hypothetical protein
MSTKIYNGLCIYSTEHKEIQKVIDYYREVETINVSKRFYQNLIEFYFRLKSYQENITTTLESYSSFYKKNKDRLYDNKLINIYSDIFDYYSQYPDSDCLGMSDINSILWFRTIEDKTLFYVSGDHEVYKNMLNLENVFEYGYWNNTDKPDNVKQAEWKKRASDWEFLYDLSDSMASIRQKVMSFSILIKNNTLEEILRVIPSTKSKIIEAFSTYYFYSDKERKEKIEEALKRSSFSEYFAVEREGKSFLTKYNVLHDKAFIESDFIESLKLISDEQIVNEILYKKFKIDNSDKKEG